MYQPLMTNYRGWAASRGTMHQTRVFEHTADHLKERFKPGGVTGRLDVNAIRGLPALFAGETTALADEPQYARLGTILNVTSIGNDYQIEYVYDTDVPPSPTLAYKSWRPSWASTSGSSAGLIGQSRTLTCTASC